MTSVNADPHNFGQQVTRDNGPGGHSIYRKPRPIFWEWLFFGSDSPLRPLLSERQLAFQEQDGGARAEIGTIADVAMGLRVEFSDAKRGLGYSFAVEPADMTPEIASEVEMGRFGAVLAYCYALGIQDVHYQNIIRTKDRPQVVDAEVVLSKLILPDETILLPFGEHPWQRAGISQYASTSALSLGQARALIAGFASALVELERIAIPLSDAIQLELGSRPPIPIRVILRDTFRYNAGTAGTTEKPLMPEEIVQSSRGDIPYFFKFLGSNDLYHYVSRKGAFAKAVVPAYFQDAVKRIAVDPKQLLEPKRLGTDLLSTGLLQLCRSLLPVDWNGSLQFDSSRVQVTPEALSVFLPTGAFQAKRKRPAVRA